MAMQLLVQVGANASSGIRDVRSVGSKTMPIRVQVTNNSAEVTIQQSPTSTGLDSGGNSVLLPLGTIAPTGGSVVIDEPVDYILITTAAGETGPVDAYVTTSR